MDQILITGFAIGVIFGHAHAYIREHYQQRFSSPLILGIFIVYFFIFPTIIMLFLIYYINIVPGATFMDIIRGTGGFAPGIIVGILFRWFTKKIVK